MKPQVAGSLMVLSSLAIFSTFGISTRFLGLNPVIIVFFYAVSAAPAFFVISCARFRGVRWLRDPAWPRYLLVAAVLCVDLALLLYAYSKTSMARTAFLHFAGPVWIILVSKRDGRLLTDLGLAAAALFGVACVFSGRSGTADILGDTAAFLSSFTLAGNVLAQKAASPRNAIPVVGFFYAFFMAALLLPVVLMLPLGHIPTSIVPLGVLYLCLGTGLYNLGVRRIAAKTAGIFGYFEVFLASIWGILFFGERLLWLAVVGMVTIAAVNAINLWRQG
ncbi:MAG: hypothetical protein KatS3mg082_1408 [Nitrospiraceae bacterium]|nr:MAG: hypothetical protein KatS3mg082_1408 [Nitrospiraceae bacterium]